MNIRKIGLVSCVVAGLMASSAMAKEMQYEIFTGISSLSIDHGDSSANYSVGYGVTRVFDNSIVFGVTFDIDYAKTDDTKLYGLGTDFKLGYNVWDKVNIYAIGSAKLQSIDNESTTGAGFGYGAGIDYAITQHITTAVEYKTYHMTSDYSDYNYNTIGLKLKYVF